MYISQASSPIVHDASAHDITLQKKNTLDHSERQLDGRRSLSFCRNLRDSMRILSVNLDEVADQEVVSSGTSSRPQHEEESSTKAGSRVRFDVDNVQVLGHSSEISETDKAALWWQDTDYQDFVKSMDATSSDLYQTSERVAGSYSSTMKKVYEACCNCALDDQDILSKRDRMELVSWTRVAISRRGLEYRSIPFLAEAKSQNREKAIQSVLALQKRMENGAAVFDSDSKCDSLRKLSEKRTESAKTFARVLAEADAAALVAEAADASTDAPVRRRARRRCSI